MVETWLNMEMFSSLALRFFGRNKEKIISQINRERKYYSRQQFVLYLALTGKVCKDFLAIHSLIFSFRRSLIWKDIKQIWTGCFSFFFPTKIVNLSTKNDFFFLFFSLDHLKTVITVAYYCITSHSGWGWMEPLEDEMNGIVQRWSHWVDITSQCNSSSQ